MIKIVDHEDILNREIENLVRQHTLELKASECKSKAQIDELFDELKLSNQDQANLRQ